MPDLFLRMEMGRLYHLIGKYDKAAEHFARLVAALEKPDKIGLDESSTKKLMKDLTIDPRNANGVAHIVRDDHHNVYEGCGFDNACNYVP